MFLFALQAVNIQIPESVNLDATQSAAMGSFLGGFGAAMIGVMIIAGIIGIIIAILSLVDIYHWGMADKAAFTGAGQDKKKWFINLILIPFIACIVMIIPFLGWIIGAILYIYWLVMTLIYFFSIRKKIAI